MKIECVCVTPPAPSVAAIRPQWDGVPLVILHHRAVIKCNASSVPSMIFGCNLAVSSADIYVLGNL